MRPISETRIRLTNGGASHTVTVKYDNGTGPEDTASKVLVFDQVAYAIAYDGAVAIVTPSATSTASGKPASLALDGSTSSSSYWSSTATTLTNPECLVLDMSTPVNIGRITMDPRSGFGPKNYKIQTTSTNTTCSSESGWTTRATVTSSGDGTTKVHTWTPGSARYVRIRVTAACGSSPFSVGIKELTPASN